MGRPTTKTDLLDAATSNFEKLNTVISSMSEKENYTIFDILKDEKKRKYNRLLFCQCHSESL